MDKTTITMNVLFEDPFWIGVLEREQEGTLSVSKVTFGAEPKDGEVFFYINEQYVHLRFSPNVSCKEKKLERTNPKRRQREARNYLKADVIGTKSQQALNAMREETKLERKERSKQKILEEKERIYLLKQQKRKEKHKGR